MNVTSTNSTLSLGQSVSDHTNQDRKYLLSIGKELRASENSYRSAINSGDEGAIAAAQMDYEKTAQKLKAKVELASAINRIINSIIEKIGQIGR